MTNDDKLIEAQGRMWITDDFQEFRRKALDGYVTIDIIKEDYPRLHKEVLPPSGCLSLLFGDDYEERLLKKMTMDESVFRQVCGDYGTDFTCTRNQTGTEFQGSDNREFIAF